MTPRALLAPARLAGTSLLRSQTDERLVDLVRAGNTSAFEAVVTRYRRPLLRYCSGLLGDGRAEDVVQQTFVRAYDALRAADGEMALRPWLYKIAHNQSLNAMRDRSPGHERLSEAVDGVEPPDQTFERRERLRDTVAAVEALPERQRDAIVLRELEGRSYDDIAAELGVTGGAVRQLLSRARGTLRAGMTAVTPSGLVGRMPWAAEGGDGMAARVAELCGAGAAGAALTKVCATALVTGAVVGGVAGTPDSGPLEERERRGEAARPAEAAGGSRLLGGLAAGDWTAEAERPGRGGVGGSSGNRGGDDHPRGDRSGPRDGDGDRDGHRSGRGDTGNSGPGSGDPRSGGPSGPGSGSSGSGSGSNDSGPGKGGSAPGSGSSGSSNSGSSGSSASGSGSSGSGSESSNSGSGSSPSGSGSSGSGSESSGSGSGSSGSDTGSSGSGSGSSGSGSGSSASGSGSSGSGSESSGSGSSGSEPASAAEALGSSGPGGGSAPGGGAEGP